MPLYAIFSKPDDGPEAIAAVPERFSWAAFVLTPLWALAHKAWMIVVAWVVVVLALDRVVPFIGVDAAIALYGLFALWVGFAAPQIRERTLERGGWLGHGALVATGVEEAETVWLRQLYGGRA